MHPQLVSIQIGSVALYGQANARDPHDREWSTAFYKLPVTGPVEIGPLGLHGDEQADLENHGGVDKAVLLYAATHYPAWQSALNLPSMPFGGFGENLTVA